MDIKIVIATHKNYWMPQDEMYLPVHVGSAVAEEKLSFQGDDTGENISTKNANYCELTGLYWAWKNLKADYIGLVHYRRYIANSRCARFFHADKRKAILTSQKAAEILKTVDVILPKKRAYYIETLYSHYAHTHDHVHLEETRKIIEGKYPGYTEIFDQVLERKRAHMFNMFIMKKTYFHAYCEWLFDILGELEHQIDTSGMTAYEARYMGRISELLLDVWLEKNHISYRELPHLQLEWEKWPKKIKSFLAAKYKNEKYKESF